MILFDTNVVSEPLRPAPNAQVVEWIDAQPLQTLYLSVVTVADLRAGVAMMPAGRRREILYRDLERLVLPRFADRILLFDLSCTVTYAEVLAGARAKGRPIAMADACIAAMAIANGFVVASRDAGVFESAGIEVVDPWSA